MQIYEYIDYKAFVLDWMQTQVRSGHGYFRKIAIHLRVHSTFVSHIFKGDKDLSLEQAIHLTKFIDLSPRESEYFLLLVQYNKAGSQQLKDFFYKRINQIQVEMHNLKSHFEENSILHPWQVAEFYTNWYYSAIRLATDLNSKQTEKFISEKLGLDKELVKKVLQFLIKAKLCHYQNGKYSLGPAITHIEANSPFVANHHRNWRIKSLGMLEKIDPEDLVFTAPITISKQDAKKFRKELMKLINQLKTTVKQSKSQELRVLNIDWMKLI